MIVTPQTRTPLPARHVRASRRGHAASFGHQARKRGFSLIDAITAIVILSVGVPSLMWAIRDSQRTRATPVMTSRARWLAAEQLEDTFADRHSSTRGYAYLINANYPSESSIASFPGYSRDLSIIETGPTLSGSGTGYKLVTVNVQYRDGWGASRTYSLSTVLTDYTP